MASNFFKQRENRCRAETRRQFTGSHSPRAVLTKKKKKKRLQPHCSAENHKNEQIQDSQCFSVSGTVLARTIMTTLITTLILAGLVFWLTALTPAVLHRWSLETSGVKSDPVLPSSGETMILSASPKKKVKKKKKRKKESACCSCQECLQLRCIKLSSNAIFIVCYMKQSAFHRLSNDV